MKDIITIGEKEVQMTANAATPYLYSKIFKGDFFVETQQAENGAEGKSIDIASKAGFVMSKQGEDMPFRKLIELSDADYYEWLTHYDLMDLIDSVGDIMTLCTAQAKAKSTAKK